MLHNNIHKIRIICRQLNYGYRANFSIFGNHKLKPHEYDSEQ
jgi:hypothetical protein